MKPSGGASLLLACLAALIAVPSRSGDTHVSTAKSVQAQVPQTPGLESILSRNPKLLPTLGLTQDALPALQRVFARDPAAAEQIEAVPRADQAAWIRRYVQRQAESAFKDEASGAYGERWFEERESLINDLEKLRPLLSHDRSDAVQRLLSSAHNIAWDGRQEGRPDGPDVSAGPMKKNAAATLSPPSRSRTDWQAAALQDAGIGRADWAPEKGFRHNRPILEKVYDWYARANAGPEKTLEWPGWAKVAGGVVYKGLGQIQRFKVLYVGDSALSKTQVALLEMNKAIFMDLGWQIQAYREGGIKALQDQFVRGEMSLGNFLAWRTIDLGSPALIRAGNMALLRREQEIIVQPGYEEIKQLPKVPKRMSFLVQSPLPDGQRFARSIPGGDVTEFDQRWAWINRDLIDKWTDMEPAERERLVELPLPTLAKRRFQPRRAISWKAALRAVLQRAQWIAFPLAAVALPALVAYWAQPFSTGISYPAGQNNLAEDVLQTSVPQGWLNLLVAATTALMGAFAYGSTLRRLPFREANRAIGRQIGGAILGTLLGAFLGMFLFYIVIGSILLDHDVSRVAVHHFAEASGKLAAVAGALIGAWKSREPS